MKLTLDVENTVTQRDGKMHLDPFEPTNSLTMVGMLTDTGLERRVTFDHSDAVPTPNGHEQVQEWLDKATILIGHNIAYDLVWLWESGFKYDGPVFDTMLAEYVLQRGIKEALSLQACAERYDLDTKKQDTLKEYFRRGYITRTIPLDEFESTSQHVFTVDFHPTVLKTILRHSGFAKTKWRRLTCRCHDSIALRGTIKDVLPHVAPRDQ